MNVTADFLAGAEECIHAFFMSNRPAVLAAYGNITEDIKNDHTPVTAMDIRLETELRPILEKFAPGIGFEGEETGKTGNSETFWLVDPIDGTESFIRGLPFMRHMVTLIDGG